MGIDTGMLGILSIVVPFKAASASFAGVLAATLLGLSMIFVILCNYPRLKSPTDSLFYFGTISRMNRGEFHEAFSSLDDESLLNDLLDQCHRNSEIVQIKMRNLQRAYATLAIAIVPWVAALLLS